MRRTPVDDAPHPDGIRKLSRRIGYVVILAGMAGFTINFGQQAWADHQRYVQVHAAAGAVAIQQQQIKKLRREVDSGRSSSFIVNHARAWGYVKKGEMLVNIKYLAPRTVPRTIVQPHISTPVPVWQQWWNAFTGH